MPRKKPTVPLRVWALLGARAGDNNQVLALAEALGLPFEVKQLDYNGLRRLGPRLLGSSLRSLARSSRALITGEAPPDLTISAGHRSVPIVQWLRQISGGRTRSIHVGFPRVSPGQFDLVIATPQYPIADHPNLLRMPYALTRAATALPDPSDHALVEKLPAPRRLIIVGGPTLFWNLDEARLLGKLAGLIAEARRAEGSVMVATSARTPARLREAIGAALDASAVPNVLAEPGRVPAMTALLDAADEIHVTADSVAMVSDAIWSGKPLALLPVVKSNLGEAAIGTFDRLRPGHPLYPQDLRRFWRALDEIGVSEHLRRPRTSRRQYLQALTRRIAPILDAARRHAESIKKNGGRGKD